MSTKRGSAEKKQKEGSWAAVCGGAHTAACRGRHHRGPRVGEAWPLCCSDRRLGSMTRPSIGSWRLPPPLSPLVGASNSSGERALLPAVSGTHGSRAGRRPSAATAAVAAVSAWPRRTSVQFTKSGLNGEHSDSLETDALTRQTG